MQVNETTSLIRECIKSAETGPLTFTELTHFASKASLQFGISMDTARSVLTFPGLFSQVQWEILGVDFSPSTEQTIQEDTPVAFLEAKEAPEEESDEPTLSEED